MFFLCHFDSFLELLSDAIVEVSWIEAFIAFGITTTG